MGTGLAIILFEPEIPQNTGNIGRLCAFTNTPLHLIRPLGFSLDDRYLRRSGMDYWKDLEVQVHDSWEAFKNSRHFPARIWLLTTHASRPHWEAGFSDGDGLLFGNEGHGCPDWLHREIGADQSLTIRRFSSQPLRSLNLSTAAGIVTYEACRQLAGGVPCPVSKSTVDLP